MFVGVLDVGVIVADDIVIIQIGGALGTGAVHGAAPPDGLAFVGQQHALMHVERPPVIARQPRHIGRIGDKQRVQPAVGHFGACFRQTCCIFVLCKRMVDHVGIPARVLCEFSFFALCIYANNAATRVKAANFCKIWGI